MNEQDDFVTSPTEQLFTDSRRVANSPLKEMEREEQRLGWDQPIEEPAVEAMPEAPVESVEPVAKPSKMDLIKGSAKLAAKATFYAMNPNLVGQKDDQAIAGSIDTASQILQTGYDVANYVDEFLVKNGFTKEDMLADDFKVDLAGDVLDMAAPQSDRDRTLRGVGKFTTQFAAFVGTGGTSGTAMGFAKGVAAGGAVSFAAFDPHEERLSNFLIKYPATQNVVTEYLAAKDTDGALEGRFKNALENMLGDVALAAAFRGVVGLAKWERSRKAARGVNLLDSAPTPAPVVDDLAKTNVDTAPNPAAVADEALEATKTEPLPEGVEPAAVVANAEQSAEIAAKNGADPLAGEMRNADLPKDLNPEQVAAAKASTIGMTTAQRVGALSDDEMVTLSGIINLEKHGMEQGPMARLALEEAEMIKGARIELSDAARDAEALQYLKKNREAILARKPGEAVDPIVSRAATLAVKIVDSQMTASRAKFAELKLSGASAEALDIARAEYVQLVQGAGEWMAAATGTGNVAALSLRAQHGIADTGAKLIFDEMQLVKDINKFTGSPAEIDAMIMQHDEMIKAGITDPLGKIAKVSKWTSFQKATKTLLMQGMLSNPITHVRNMASNTINLVMLPIDKLSGIAGRLVPDAISPSEFKMSNELALQWFGKPASQISAAELGEFRAMQSKMRPLEEAGSSVVGFVQGTLDNIFTMRFMMEGGTFSMAATGKFNTTIKQIPADKFADMSWLQKATHFMSHVVPNPKSLQKLKNGGSPLGALGIEDAFFGSIFERMEHRALARRYSENIGKTALEKQAAFEKVMRDPPDFMQKMIVRERNERLFVQDFEGFNQSIVKALGDIPLGVGTAIAPFTKVAVNTTMEALQRTSVLGLATKNVRNALAAGGAARDAAIGKMALGTAVATYGATLAAQGLLTGAGPANPSARQALMNTGWKPYSVKIGDDYYSLSAFEGVGKVFKSAADVHDIMAYIPDAQESGQIPDLILSGVAMGVNYVTADFLIEDIGKFTNAVKNPQSKETKNYLTSKALSVVVPGAARFTQQYVTDGTKRLTMADPEDPWSGLINNFMANTPGLSETLPPNRNMWGEEIVYSPGLGPYNASPISFTKDKDLTVEREFVRLGVSGPLYQPKAKPGEEHFQAKMPPKYFDRDGVRMNLNPEQYDAFVQLSAGSMEPLVKAGRMKAGEAAQYEKNNLKSQLKELITQPDWATMSDRDKKVTINEAIRTRREAAKDIVLSLFPELQFDQLEGQIDQMSAGGVGPAEIKQMKSELKAQERSAKGEPRI